MWFALFREKEAIGAGFGKFPRFISTCLVLNLGYCYAQRSEPMRKKNIHTVCKIGEWQTGKEGQAKPLSSKPTKDAAKKD